MIVLTGKAGKWVLVLCCFGLQSSTRTFELSLSFFLPGLGVGWPDPQAFSPPVPHHVLVSGRLWGPL